MKRNPRLILLRVLMSGGLLYFLWQAAQAAMSRSWAEAAMHVGFVCSALAAAIRPSYLLGPALPSPSDLAALPPEQQLQGPAQVFILVALLFFTVALALWLASRIS
jgi:hypothetical protein